ncbi:hypothetical protein PYW08_011963 [Mythimna loreyi]|uniref:Uncharacterized protein n=1 Tax=Mythimna loreyi TaxID=667449 RepID=A0ACC2QNI6_9NEOP|nr:hypothetical protein PYW08_011963 [Mythimna loreyi]
MPLDRATVLKREKLDLKAIRSATLSVVRLRLIRSERRGYVRSGVVLLLLENQEQHEIRLRAGHCQHVLSRSLETDEQREERRTATRQRPLRTLRLIYRKNVTESKSRVIIIELCKWLDHKMCSTGSILLLFVLNMLSSSTHAFRLTEDMNWVEDPADAWPYSSNQLETRVVVLLLNVKNYIGYLTKKQMKDFDTIHEIVYTTEDAAVADCDEWLPREWGFFICIRNIGNFPGLGSGAVLYTRNRVFGIGSFAMFKDDIGVFVFTDVRPYTELIEKTCSDEEFT